MLNRTPSLLALGLIAASSAAAQGTSIPSVVVTVENAQVGRGTFLTPPWIGIHDGSFDTYDGGQPANVPLGGNEIEALAEDGNNAPLTATFDLMQPGAPQVQGVAGATGPLAPGESASVTLNVDPSQNRYFSYASMVIPSNDAFIANGNPTAHQLFDTGGNFVGQSFVVSGDETNDAGTEVNDEIPANTAFLAQAGPNIGDTENGVVMTPSPGFAPAGMLAFPNGILNYPVFANGDFNDADDRVFAVRFRYVDLGTPVLFEGSLSSFQELQTSAVLDGPRGTAIAEARDGARLRLFIRGENLTGPITAAHLHLGGASANGPVIVDLTSSILGNGIAVIDLVNQADLTGPLAGASFVEFLNQLAAGNVYVNLHTAQFPMGEARGQLLLAD